MEAQLEPLQNEAKSGVGKTLTVPEPARLVRFIMLIVLPLGQSGALLEDRACGRG